MARHEHDFDPGVIEAEENFIIDFQFLLQELMARKGISRTELADLAGISKARLSQIMGSEANPTAKTFARLFHAIGEEIQISTKKPHGPRRLSGPDDASGWQWAAPAAGEKLLAEGRKKQLVAVVKDSMASNDNHVLLWDGRQSVTLKAA